MCQTSNFLILSKSLDNNKEVRTSLPWEKTEGVEERSSPSEGKQEKSCTALIQMYFTLEERSSPTAGMKEKGFYCSDSVMEERCFPLRVCNRSYPLFSFICKGKKLSP